MENYECRSIWGTTQLNRDKKLFLNFKWKQTLFKKHFILWKILFEKTTNSTYSDYFDFVESPKWSKFEQLLPDHGMRMYNSFLYRLEAWPLPVLQVHCVQCTQYPKTAIAFEFHNLPIHRNHWHDLWLQPRECWIDRGLPACNQMSIQNPIRLPWRWRDTSYMVQLKQKLKL